MPLVSAYDSRSTIATDPLRNFKFAVELHHGEKDSAARFGFLSVSGLSVATEPIPYREGGDNTTPRKLPGQSNFGDVTLSKGVVIGSWRNWYQKREIFHAIQGYGRATVGNNFRFTADIHVLHHPVNYKNQTNNISKVTVRLYNAWPVALTYTDLDAGGNTVWVETMTLAHEGFDIHWATNAGGGTNPYPPA